MSIIPYSFFCFSFVYSLLSPTLPQWHERALVMSPPQPLPASLDCPGPTRVTVSTPCAIVARPRLPRPLMCPRGKSDTGCAMVSLKRLGDHIDHCGAPFSKFRYAEICFLSFWIYYKFGDTDVADIFSTNLVKLKRV